MISRGSEWHRWEPHIHAPGTVINNQFSGPTAWPDYLSALEAATPTIEAIAVTDYYVTETYERVLEYKRDGRLPSAKLILPNVELRLDVATVKGGFVNLHLLASPEDTDHLAQLQRLLSRLHFTVQQDRFDCTRSDLIRLGKKADPTITDERAALAYGASQYKVNFMQLREAFAETKWARENVLVAVAGGATDWYVRRQGGRRPDPAERDRELCRCDFREQSGATRVLARRTETEPGRNPRPVWRSEAVPPRKRRPQARRGRDPVR